MRRVLQALLIAAAVAAAAGAPASVRAQTKPAVTTLGPDFPKSEIFIGNNKVNYGNFSVRLNQATNNNYDMRIYIRADKKVVYKEVMRLMNVIQDTGYYQIALVAEDKGTQ